MPYATVRRAALRSVECVSLDEATSSTMGETGEASQPRPASARGPAVVAAIEAEIPPLTGKYSWVG